MTDKTKGKKRLLWQIALTLLFTATAGIYLYHTNPPAELSLILQVKLQQHKKGVINLYIGKELPRRARKKSAESSANFREIRFFLPRGKIRDLRLSMGKVKGNIAVKSLTVKGLFKSYTLTGRQIYRLFKRTHHVNKRYVRNNIFYMDTGSLDHWIAPSDTFYQVLDKMQRDKTPYYLLLVPAALLFFYFLYFLDVRSLRIFFSSRVVSNSVLVILLILFFPLLNKVLKVSDAPGLVEKRTMSRKPEFRLDSLSGYFKEYTPYYNDHFTLRNTLIYLNNLLKLKFYGISATKGVVMGKYGWLFLDDQETRTGTIRYFRSMTLFTPQELERWKKLLEERHRWLAARGAAYLFVIVPNKNTIYPEYMPDHIRRVQPLSRMDQLLDYLEKHSTVRVLDVRPALIAAKKERPVYSRTDSHWNDFGAYIMQREIVTYISRFPAFKGAQPLPLSRFRIETLNRSGGDLAAMLSLHQEVLREDMIKLRARPVWSFWGGSLERISRFIKQGYTQSSSLLPGIMMVHDSFYKKIKPFLSERFSRVLYIWDWDMNFYPQIIEKEKPALLIDEMAERFLMENIPVNPPLLTTNN
jgi:Mor family transcriptional regulator